VLQFSLFGSGPPLQDLPICWSSVDGSKRMESGVSESATGDPLFKAADGVTIDLSNDFEAAICEPLASKLNDRRAED
jgi:hypothetical protein